MNFDEKPRSSVGDTLRAALPEKCLRAIVILRWLFFVGLIMPNAMWLFFVGLMMPSATMTLIINHFVSSLKVTNTTIVLFQISSGACFAFLSWLVIPFRREREAQQRHAREYSRQQKMMAEHEKILQRWQRDVKPEGKTQHET